MRVAGILTCGEMLGDEHQNALTKCYSKVRSRAHNAVIRVYDAAGNVIETHEHKGESSTYTRFGSTLTTSGERNAPRWL
jgi:YD repeat-containing protein